MRPALTILLALLISRDEEERTSPEAGGGGGRNGGFSTDQTLKGRPGHDCHSARPEKKRRTQMGGGTLAGDPWDSMKGGLDKAAFAYGPQDSKNIDCGMR